MNKKKLLAKLQLFLSPDFRRKKSHQKELKEILKKLKKKEMKIALKIEATTDKEEKKQLQIELKIIHAQRKKGIEAWLAENHK